MIASDERIVFATGGFYDDGSGPAAMPPKYAGFAPSEPIAEPGGDRPIVISTRIKPAQPVLIDAPTGSGGIAANAPKVPETPAAVPARAPIPAGAPAPAGTGAPVLRAGGETLVTTTTEHRVMIGSLVLLAIVVAYITWREARDS